MTTLQTATRRLGVILATTLAMVAGAAQAQQEPPVLNIYNWGDYIEPEVLDLFEQETGIKVYVMDEPLLSVVLGSGMALEDMDRYKKVFIN